MKLSRGTAHECPRWAFVVRESAGCGERFRRGQAAADMRPRAPAFMYRECVDTELMGARGRLSPDDFDPVGNGSIAAALGWLDALEHRGHDSPHESALFRKF